MPLPIVPAPITPTFLIVLMGSPCKGNANYPPGRAPHREATRARPLHGRHAAVPASRTTSARAIAASSASSTWSHTTTVIGCCASTSSARPGTKP